MPGTKLITGPNCSSFASIVSPNGHGYFEAYNAANRAKLQPVDRDNQTVHKPFGTVNSDDGNDNNKGAANTRDSKRGRDSK